MPEKDRNRAEVIGSITREGNIIYKVKELNLHFNFLTLFNMFGTYNKREQDKVD